MFEINEGKVSLVSMNTRTEKHGEQEVLGCDLDFRWETSNGVLAIFAPELRSSLYKASDGPQMEIDPDPDHLVALRFPFLGVLKWGTGDVIGGALKFITGVSAKSHVLVEDVKVHKYRIECKEGGTVVVAFQVQCRPSEVQIGKFSKFLTDKECIISIIPPGSDAE